MKTVLAILLMILGLFVHRVEGVFSKKYGEKHHEGGAIFTATVAFFSMLFFLIGEVVTDAGGLQFEKGLVLFGLIGGACFATACVTMYWVLSHGPYGVSSLLSSYSILITIGYGLFIGERLSPWAWGGVILICVSLVLVMERKQEDEKVKLSAGWLAVLVFSVLCSAAFGVLQRQQQIVFCRAYDNEFMVVVLGVAAGILFVVGRIKDGKRLKTHLKGGFFYAAVGGVANGMANFLTLAVYTLVPISFAAPMRTGIGIVIAFLIARLIFKEKYTARQYLGVALGSIALVVFNL